MELEKKLEILEEAKHFIGKGFPKLKPEVRAAWVTALRSGEYRQTKFALCVKEKYCCWGVFAVLNGAELLGSQAGSDEQRVKFKGYSITTSIEPIQLGEFLEQGSFTGNKIKEAIKYFEYLNDHELSFADIADEIEKHL